MMNNKIGSFPHLCTAVVHNLYTSSFGCAMTLAGISQALAMLFVTFTAFNVHRVPLPNQVFWVHAFVPVTQVTHNKLAIIPGHT